MDAEILYIPWNENQEANDLAQHASKYKELEVKEHDYESTILLFSHSNFLLLWSLSLVLSS